MTDPDPDRPVRSNGPVRRHASTLSLTLAVLVVLALVILSPFSLVLLADNDGVNWDSLSTVGQTYGAISAVLAVLALVGIAASLVVQSREAKANREQGLRSLHNELMKMSMADPDFMECWGPFRPGRDPRQLRQTVFTNMIVSHWESMFETGSLDEPHLRNVSADMFRGAPGRRFWEGARERRLATANGKRSVRFHRILDEEFRRVVREGDTGG
ncbi:DUF6082 family protein [Streptomyces sp. NPDC001443]